jgi:hypothetical protein
VTTRNLGAAYPLMAESGLGHRGVVIGRDLLGGSFIYDPFDLYAAGAVSNPNMVVIGQIGRGKSALMKTYLWRQALFGRRAWVVDPKGEYGALAERWGVTPVSLRPGGPFRLNPLDPAPDPVAANGHRAARGPGPGDGPSFGGVDPRHAELLASLAAACLRRDLVPRERVAVELALATAARHHRVPTVPAVVDALLDPPADAARSVRTDPATLLEDGRDVALELRRMVHGDLRGMFDGPTTPGIDLSGPLVVLDLSALYDSAALGVLMACATAWLHGALARHTGHPRPDGGRVLLVVDEAWAILANLGVARWLQASWKLSRAFGVANVAVLHRLSDLQAVGAAGSQQVDLAQGLLADSETQVVYAQPPAEVDRAAELLSLSPTEAELLPHLGRGVALWKVGSRSFLVRHLTGPDEASLVDTDAAMSGRVDP